MKLSIITVNLNNRDGLKKTIDSVVSQTFRDFEWFVIDGGSTDGSKALYFQNAMYVFLMLLGLYVEVERHTTDGRMEMPVQTKDYIHIFELKIDQSADAALRQIEEKQYAAPFAADPRKLFKIGASFSTEKRCIDDWKVK